MAGIVRLGDASTGHAHCYPSTTAISGSPNVYVNGRPVVCVGDSWATHGACKDHSPHSGTSSGGSSTVFCNGKPVCRAGDPISCGDTMSECSSDVFAGG